MSSDLQKNHRVAVDALKSTILIKEGKISDLENTVECVNAQVSELDQLKSLCKSKSNSVKRLENQKKDLQGSLDLIKKQLSTYKTLGEKTAVSFNTCRENWVSLW